MAADFDGKMEILPFFTATLIIGIQLGSIFPNVEKWLYFSTGLMILCLTLFAPVRGKAGLIPLLIIGICTGAFIFLVRQESDIPETLLKKFNHAEGSIRGEFVGEFKFLRREGLSFIMENVEVTLASQTFSLPRKVRCEVRSLDLLPEPGQRYAATGTLNVVKGRRKPNFVTSGIQVSQQQAIFDPFIGKIQRWVRDGTSSLLSKRHYGFMLGFLVGDTSQLGTRDREIFRETGISHLLAVSGQHIFSLGLVLLAVMSWAGIPPISRSLLAAVALILFGFVTGGQPSVWRALVMYLAAVFIIHAEADPGPIRPIALAALLLLLYRPDWLHHVGFQLSFLAVLGMLIGRPPVEEFLCRRKIPLVLARYLALSFSANIATVPLVACYFGFVSIISFAVNPLLIWMFSLILTLGVILAGLGHFWFAAGVALSSALSLILDGFLAVVEFMALVPGGVIPISFFPGIFAAFSYGMMLYFIQNYHLVQVNEPAGKIRETTLPMKIKPLSGAPGSGGAGRQASQRWESSGGSVQQGSGPSVPGWRPSDGPITSQTKTSPARRFLKPLSDQVLLETIDQQLSIFRKRSLKSKGNLEAVSFPIQRLTVEGQTLFFRLDDLSRSVLRDEPDRMMQAQVFTLALLGSEIMAKIPGRLSPPVLLEEVKIPLRAKNRYLALAVFTEAFFSSTFPARTGDPVLAALIGRAQRIHQEGHQLLGTFMRERNLQGIVSHFSSRQATLEWCKDLCKFFDAME